MQFPQSWLREFCNPPLGTQEVADTLTMAGLEVEALSPVAPPFEGVVVGEILTVAQHPDADRLRVCSVDVGAAAGSPGVPLNIVCGAPNVQVGMRVPCALVGASLPPGDDGKPLLIGRGMLRGVISEGMLCSARELGLSQDHSGLLELSGDAPVGLNVRDCLTLDDTLFTLKLTPNLAHALSVQGVARELSALTGAPLHQPAIAPVAVTHQDRLPVTVSDADLCGRFCGRIIRDVNPKARTPAWMLERLARCGQRGVSALVDISNYVMFELGRPSHVFDLDKIKGGLEVRWARAGEQLTLLNGNTVVLDERVGVIADAVQVESLAGIMGGEATAVSDDTRHVYLEAAFWWPAAIAGRSRRFNFSTDAGHRFERGVDPGTTLEHLERITQLILEICGGSAGPVDDVQTRMPAPKVVSLRIARAVRVIGMPLTQAACAGALRKLGLAVEEGDGVLHVTPPSYRFDLQIEEDLIEEVARLIGYESLPVSPPLAPITARLKPESARGPYAVRRAMAALGYQETINFSFVEERWETELAGNTSPVRLLNPIASPLSVMRSSLIGSLLQVLRFNLARKASNVRVFEIGRVFLRDPQAQDGETSVAGVHQPMRLAGMSYGSARPLHWEGSDQGVDFYDLKADVEALLSPRLPVFEAAEHPALHPGRCARVLLDGVVIGHLGELHPQWRQSYELPRAAMVFELDLAAVLARDVPRATPVERFQSVQRDLAVIVADRVTHAQLMSAVFAAPTLGCLRDAVLFDVYKLADGHKSLAVRLTLNHREATLTEAQIQTCVDAVLQQLERDVGARLRA